MLNYEDTLRYLTEWAEGSVLDREDEEALRSAIALIKTGEKAQKLLEGYELDEQLRNLVAPIKTIEELRMIPIGSVLWHDYRNPDDGTMAPAYPICFEGFAPSQVDKTQEAILYPDGCDYVEDYGTYFIFWKGRPTDEQRKAVKLDVDVANQKEMV